MNAPSSSQSVPDELSLKRSFYARLLIIVIGSIFFAEVVAMFIIYELPPLPYQYVSLIDAGIMTILIFPVLYFLSFQPLIRHIEKREQAERSLRHVNRALSVLNECNQILVRSERESELLQQMCETLVNTGQYRMAWVGFAEQDEARSVHPVAQFGFEVDYLDAAQISWADNERGHGPTGMAIREGIAQVNQNFLTNPHMAPWRESALLRGYQSSIALPLQSEGSILGVLTIYSASPDAFDPEEVHLLQELANNLAFGVIALRVRAERNWAEDLNRRLSRIVEQTEDTVVVTNCEGAIEYVNPAFERLTGYTQEEFLGKTPRVIKSGIHDAEFYQRMWNTILAGDVFQNEIANRKKNGELYYEVKTITPLRDADGKITHFVATGKDITEHKLDEEKLLKAYDQLELRVQERTEELRIANSELEDEIRIRRQMEEALRQSEQRLSRAQEIAHLGSWELDLVTGELTWSDEVYRIFGLQPQEFGATYEAFLEHVHPQDRAAVDDAYSSSIREGRDQYEIEHRVVKHSSGELRIVHEKCEHFRNEAGQVIRSVGMVHDITERKQAEKALRLSEEKFRSAFANASIGFAMTMPDGRFVDANPAYAALTGYKIEELRAMEFSSLIHPEDRAENMRLINKMLAGELADFVVENRYLRKDIDPVWVRKSVSLVRDTNGVPQWVIALVEDITQRRLAEDALRLSEEKYRLLADNSNDWIYWIKPDRSFQYISPACERVTGFHSFDFMSNPHLLIEIIHPEDRKLMEAHLVEMGESDKTHNLEYRILTKANEIRWVSHSCTPVFSVEGAYMGRNGTNRDITERKQVEEALRKAHNELEQRVAELQTLMDVAPAGIAIGHGPDGHVITGNHLLSEWLGAPEQANVSLSTSEEERQVQYQVFREGKPVGVEDLPIQYAVLNARGIRNDELTVVRSDGESIELLANAEPLFNNQGHVRGAIATFIDISGRKRAEAALRAAHDELELRVQERTKELVKEITERKEVERQLRIQTTAMEAAANGIIITDPMGCIQWTNPALLQITGYEDDELIGQNMRVFNSGLHNATYYHRMWGTILSGQVWRGEVTNRRKDGSLYMEEQTITPVRDETNQIQHFIAIKQDITERKRAEAELAEWNVKLQALSIAEREQRQLSESLAQAALVLNKSMNLDEVLPLILEQVKVVIPYQLAIVMMFDGDSFYDASHAGDPRWAEDLSRVKNRFPLDDFPLLVAMRQSHQPVRIPDAQKEKKWMVVHGLEWARSILCVPLLAENQVIGFLNLLAEQSSFFTVEMQDRLVAFASHASVAIQNAWLFEQVRASSERLQSLSRRLVEIQENERLYIARELHDEAGQMLTALMLDLVALESQAYHPEAVLKKAAEMEQALNAVSENLHSVAMALRPASLDHLGLVPALRQYVESIGERYRLKVSFLAGNFQARLPANMETELYRIVQEALTNVARHAHASQVDVILTVRGQKLIVMVEDDGNGFDLESVPDTGHLGLFGMRERAEMIGGELVIESKPGKGTTVMVEVDYDSSIVDRG